MTIDTQVARRTLLAGAGATAALAVAGCSTPGSPDFDPGTPKLPVPGGVCPTADPEALASGGLKPGPAGYSLPFAEGVTIRFGTPDNAVPNRGYASNLPVWQKVQELSGAKVEWQVVASAQYPDFIKTRIAANDDLPDVFSIPNGTDPIQLALDGTLAPLTKLFDQHAPNITKNVFEPFPEVKQAMTAPDGEIYFIPTVDMDPDYSGMLIRQDWLDNLGVKAPTDLNTWFDVLKAFKTENLSGSGADDVVPVVTNYWPNMYIFGNALGLHLQRSLGWYADESGKVWYEHVDGRMRDLLSWLNKLFQNQLLDPQFYTLSSEDMLARVAANRVGAMPANTNNIPRMNTLQADSGNREASWILAKPPTSTINTTAFYERPGYVEESGLFGVNAKARNIEKVIQWLDFIYASDPGSTLMSYGVEDLTYTVGRKDRLQFTRFVSDNPDGNAPFYALAYQGAMGNVPRVLTSEGLLSGFGWDTTRLDRVWYQNRKRGVCYTIPRFPALFGTPEESNESSRILSDLKTYREESQLKFILGQRSLDEWDDYMSTMSSLGVKRLIEIKQTQYDRYRSAG